MSARESRPTRPGFSVAMTIGFAFVGLAAIVAPGLPMPDFILTYAAWWLGAFIAVVVHEAGHLLAARAADLVPIRFLAMGVDIRFGARSQLRLDGPGAPLGMVVASAPPIDDLRRRAMRFVAWGPRASVLFGMCVLAGVILWLEHRQGALPAGIERVSRYLMGLGLGSMAIGIGSMMPGKEWNDLLSDGRNLRSLRRDGVACNRLLASFRLVHEYAVLGRRPSDWPDDLLAAVSAADESEPATNSAVARGHYVAYLAHADRRAWDDAETHLLRAREAAARSFALGAIVAAELAFFYAGVRGDAVRARKSIRQESIPIAGSSTQFRAHAAILCVEGKWGAARRAVERARVAFGREGDDQSGVGILILEWLDRIERACALGVSQERIGGSVPRRRMG